jgi:biotin carboxyl carrier protein
MPGRVIKVLVAPGDEVAVGQPVLVVEAMKMENELKAKTAGTVAEVHVAVGDTVEGNAKLVTFA